MTNALLPAIVAAARQSAEARASAADREALDRALEAATGSGAAFERSLREPGVRIIAECKRRSPSRGVLRSVYHPDTIAAGYAAAGAAAISVLTEPSFFDGSMEHLTRVRAAVTVPVLRKDFVVTEFQVEEARAAGADAVLLIVAALDDRSLVRLRERAAALGLAALVEVHDETELARALEAGATVLGVNSRDLQSMQVKPETFDRLAPLIPASIVAVAESGLKRGADIARLRSLRYDAFLVGERLMTESDPGAALAALREAAGASS